MGRKIVISVNVMNWLVGSALSEAIQFSGNLCSAVVASRYDNISFLWLIVFSELHSLG